MSGESDFDIKAGVLEKYKGPGGHVAIPEGITGIGKDAFRDCTALRSVTVPDSVTSIGKSAFRGCEGLTDLTIPDSVEKIGSHAFWGCKALKSVKIPGSLTFIGEKAFALDWAGHSALESLTMPDDMAVSLGLNGLNSRFDLRDLSRAMLCNPDGFSGVLRQKLISYMEKNEEGIVPDLIRANDARRLAAYLSLCGKVSLEDIDRYLQLTEQRASAACRAFLLDYKNKHFEKEKLERFYAEAEEKELGLREYSVADWRKLYRFSIADGHVTISGYRGKETTVKIPGKIGKNTVTAIGESAFRQKENDLSGFGPEEVILPGTITSIGPRAFENTYFYQIDLPDSVTVIGERAFSRSMILRIRLPAGLQEIGPDTFAGCWQLRKADIPESVGKIGEGAFWRCSSLSAIRLPPKLSRIGRRAFCGCALSEIAIPNGVKNIEDETFAVCRRLSKVILSEGVEQIGSWSFCFCNVLSDLYLPESVTFIANDAFRSCPRLSIHAPAGSYAGQYAKEHNIRFIAE